jgi:hypothetical protein
VKLLNVGCKATLGQSFEVKFDIGCERTKEEIVLRTLLTHTNTEDGDFRGIPCVVRALLTLAVRVEMTAFHVVVLPKSQDDTQHHLETERV